MKSFAHCGWTVILLVIFMISTLVSIIANFYIYGGMYDGLFFLVKYYILPAIVEVVVASMVALFSLLVAKNLLKKPHDAFFLPLNCMLVLLSLINISYPILDLFFKVMDGVIGLSSY